MEGRVWHVGEGADLSRVWWKRGVGVAIKGIGMDERELVGVG